MSASVPILASALVALVFTRALVTARARPPRELARRAIDGGTLVVRDDGPWRELVFVAERAMVHTRVAREDALVSGFAYTDAFHLGPLLAGGCARALFVGSGGAVAPRQFEVIHPRAEIDVVDLHAAVFELAQEHFGFHPSTRLRAHVGDGRAFVESAPAGNYDVMVLDAYGAFELPHHLATRQFFLAARERLRRGGALCANVVGRLNGEGDDTLHAVLRTLRATFGGGAVVTVPIALEGEDPRAPSPSALRNVVLLAMNGTAPGTEHFDAALRSYPSARLAGLASAASHLRRALRERELAPLEDGDARPPLRVT